MIVRRPFDLQEEHQREIRKAVRLEWWSLFFLATIGVAMYFTMGSSQAMKTAWIEDLLSMIPPILFLVTVRFHDDPPSTRFPWGKRRIVMLAFLGAALALLSLGGYMFVDAVMKLVKQEHPTIGTKVLFGHEIWLGWLMIATLVYSIGPPVILGHMKKKPAKSLHEKTLHADAEMNRADWLTAVAAIGGVLGIGAGFWWADSVAAGLIAADIVKDGFQNTGRAVRDLMDQRPTHVSSGEPDYKIVATLLAALTELPWVRHADLRLREEGHLVSGEAFVTPRDENHLLDRVLEAEAALRQAHWRVCEVVVVLLPEEELRRRSRANV